VLLLWQNPSMQLWTIQGVTVQRDWLTEWHGVTNNIVLAAMYAIFVYEAHHQIHKINDKLSKVKSD
jgi:hypothetical protein